MKINGRQLTSYTWAILVDFLSHRQFNGKKKTKQNKKKGKMPFIKSLLGESHIIGKMNI